jgi:hypothetical protein
MIPVKLIFGRHALAGRPDEVSNHFERLSVTLIDALGKVVNQQGIAIKALEKLVHKQPPKRTDQKFANHTATIAVHTVLFDRQMRAVEEIRHDSAVFAALALGALCQIFETLIRSALRRRRSAKYQGHPTLSTDDPIVALDQSLSRNK